jgi:hypothetical protein
VEPAAVRRCPGGTQERATVRRYVATIAHMHRAAEVGDPTKAEIVRLRLSVWSGPKARDNGRRPRSASSLPKGSSPPSPMRRVAFCAVSRWKAPRGEHRALAGRPDDVDVRPANGVNRSRSAWKWRPPVRRKTPIVRDETLDRLIRHPPFDRDSSGGLKNAGLSKQGGTLSERS